jgi:hypothetical protein
MQIYVLASLVVTFWPYCRERENKWDSYLIWIWLAVWGSFKCFVLQQLLLFFSKKKKKKKPYNIISSLIILQYFWNNTHLSHIIVGSLNKFMVWSITHVRRESITPGVLNNYPRKVGECKLMRVFRPLGIEVHPWLWRLLFVEWHLGISPSKAPWGRYHLQAMEKEPQI